MSLTRFRSPRWLASAVLFIALTAVAGQPTPSAVPDQIAAPPSAGRSVPLWIAEELAIKNGELDWAVFAPDERPALEQTLRSTRAEADSGEECPIRVSSSWHSSPWTTPAVGLEDLASKSAAVVAGKVVERRQGFYAGFPSTVIQIELEAPLSLGGGGPSPLRLLLLLPQAKIAVGSTNLCAVDGDYPAVPAIGRRALVFLRQRALETSGELIAPPLYSLIVELPNGKLDGAGRFAEEIGALNFGELQRAVQKQPSVPDSNSGKGGGA